MSHIICKTMNDVFLKVRHRGKKYLNLCLGLLVYVVFHSVLLLFRRRDEFILITRPYTIAPIFVVYKLHRFAFPTVSLKLTQRQNPVYPQLFIYVQDR